MEINAKIIERQEELLSIIKGGTNPLDYIKNESDVDLICSAIAHESKSQDPYFDETAETLLKALVYYLIDMKEETTKLKRCKEIVELGLNENDGRTKVKELFESLNDEERARALYISIDIAPDRTYKGIFETLNEKLASILN